MALPMLALPAACPHRPPCPGCPRYGAPGVAPDALASLAAFCREQGTAEPAVVTAAAGGYRRRARLAVRGRMGSPKIGIFREGTHDVVDVPRCPIHHPLVNEVAAELKRAIVATRTPTYSDFAHAGLVRYLQVVVERETERAQVVVVANAREASTIAPLLAELTTALGPRLHSLFFNGHTERHNAVLGPVWEHVAGPPCVEERMGGARVFYPPGAFGQSHVALAAQAVATIGEWVPSGQRLVELYAGVGAIGLGLVARSRQVVQNEIGAASLSGLERGIAALRPEEAARVTIVAGAASEAVSWIAPGDVLIVDPPRKGLEPEVVAHLERVAVRQIVYLSCHLPSLLRDARALIHGGGYRLGRAVAFGFFPFTDHVESLIELVRNPTD